MHLHEYQSRQCFSRFGIPTIPGKTANSPETAAAIAAEFGTPVVVRAQTPDRPRVFRRADTPEDAEHAARDLLAMTIRGTRIRTLVIEPAAEPVSQYFLGVYADRGKKLVMLASSDGGDDVSPVERGKPERLVSETINPFLGVLDFQGRNLANGINLPRDFCDAFVSVAQNLYRCFVACDAVRAEINPLGLMPGGELTALGGDMMIDDNALFRQPELVASRDTEAEYDRAALAREAGLAYLRLGGTIGCAVSGAGLGMATMDMLAQSGRGASCFVDLGSSIQRETIRAALRLLLPNAEVVLFNIFADRTSCAEIAQEFLAAVAESPLTVPVILRLAGRDADHGLSALEEAHVAHLVVAAEMTEAVRLVTAAARGYTDVNLSR